MLDGADWLSDSRVTVISTNKTERCYARNAGACAAKGKYLHILDDDDVVYPNMYMALYNRAEETGAVLTYGAHKAVDNDGNLVTLIAPTCEGNVFAFMAVGDAVPFQASFALRSCLLEAGGYDPLLIPGEDRELLKRMALMGNFCMRKGHRCGNQSWCCRLHKSLEQSRCCR